MKKTTALLLSLFLLVCPLFAACAREARLPYPYEKLKAGRTPPPLDSSLIRSVELSRYTADTYELTGEETDELIRLYNGSRVQNCYGGITPGFICFIHFTDGTVLSLRDNSSFAELAYRDAAGKSAANPTEGHEDPELNSRELYDFLLDLSQTALARAETAADLSK